MMFEEKLEEVIAGLSCCTGDQDASCEGNCPYFKGYYLDDCTDRLKADALEVLKGLQSKSGDLISRSALLDELSRRLSIVDMVSVAEIVESVPAVDAESVVHAQGGCEYCLEDSDGYRRGFGAFSLHNPFHANEWEISTGHCKPRQIYFCPMCGRKLAEPPQEVAECPRN